MWTLWLFCKNWNKLVKCNVKTSVIIYAQKRDLSLNWHINTHTHTDIHTQSEKRDTKWSSLCKWLCYYIFFVEAFRFLCFKKLFELSLDASIAIRDSVKCKCNLLLGQCKWEGILKVKWDTFAYWHHVDQGGNTQVIVILLKKSRFILIGLLK